METSEKVGVIVGRFQVPELTEGHRELLDYVLDKGHQLTILVLGVAAVPFTRENPLEFTARKAMIDDAYPGRFTIVPLADVRDDDVWSERLDALVYAVAGEKPVMLYGSRDSFAKHYTGSYEVDEFKQHICCSGTEERQKAGHMHGTSSDFRQGCVYATQGQYPTSYQTVDVLLSDKDGRVALGRKKTDPAGQWRLFGGFVDPSDNSLEGAAARELSEETSGLDYQASPVSYMTSMRIDDWRYRGLSDGILTSLFWISVPDGLDKLGPGDDISEVKIFGSYEDIDVDSDIVPEHRKLVRWCKCKLASVSENKAVTGKHWYNVRATFSTGDITTTLSGLTEAYSKADAMNNVAMDIERRGGTEISCTVTLKEDDDA